MLPDLSDANFPMKMSVYHGFVEGLTVKLLAHGSNVIIFDTQFVKKCVKKMCEKICEKNVEKKQKHKKHPVSPVSCGWGHRQVYGKCLGVRVIDPPTTRGEREIRPTPPTTAPCMKRNFGAKEKF